MKYIQKVSTPQFFLDDIKGFTKWDDYDYDENTKKKRRALREYIMTIEQNSTCAYCECAISLESSHIEHIKPKETYTSLTFDYNNLIVSCDGKCLNMSNTDTSVHRCGHKKDNVYCEVNFLNPTTVSDISDYFEYDDSGAISPSKKGKDKASYMIDLLSLDDKNLQRAREIAKEAFKKNLKKALKTNGLEKSLAISTLLKDHIAFVSFLRFYCKKNYAY